MKRTVLALCILICSFADVSAQWSAGIYGGVDWCNRSIDRGYDYARSRFALPGGIAGIKGQYNFTPWLGVRMDVNMQCRNFDDIYSIIQEQYHYRNKYVDIPLMVSFSFGGERLRGYANVGGYAGVWILQTIEHKPVMDNSGQNWYSRSGFSMADKRFDAGLAGGLGILYRITGNLEANAECMLYYALTDSHNTGSSRFSQPFYDTVPCLCLGLTWIFDRKN